MAAAIPGLPLRFLPPGCRGCRGASDGGPCSSGEDSSRRRFVAERELGFRFGAEKKEEERGSEISPGGEWQVLVGGPPLKELGDAAEGGPGVRGAIAARGGSGRRETRWHFYENPLAHISFSAFLPFSFLFQTLAN